MAATGDFELHAAQRITAGGTLISECFKAAYATFVTRSTRLNTLTNPHFFLRKKLIELGVDRRFELKLCGLLCFVCGVVPRKARELAAIKFDDARHNVVEKCAVVADDDRAAFVAREQTLKPRNRGEVQMVGWLVEQQHIGRGDERLSDCYAFFQAAGKRGDKRCWIEIELRECCVDARFPRPTFERVDLVLHI